MTTTFLGGKSIGEAMPSVNAAMSVFISGVQPKLTGAIAAAARISVTPPTLAAQLATAEQLVLALKAAIVIGLPTVNIQVTALAALILELQGQLAAIAALQATLGAGIDLYAYLGSADRIGLEGQIPPGATPQSIAGAITLVATGPAARATLGAFFGGAPIT